MIHCVQNYLASILYYWTGTVLDGEDTDFKETEKDLCSYEALGDKSLNRQTCKTWPVPAGVDVMEKR